MTAPIEALVQGTAQEHPAFIPLLGEIVPRIAQVPEETYLWDAGVQAKALLEVATAARAGAITVGLGIDPSVGADVVARITPLLGPRSIVACLSAPVPNAARAYCEAGAHALLLVNSEIDNARPFKTVANVARFYGVPTLLLAEEHNDAPQAAARLGLAGAITRAPDGSEPGIVGGGVGHDIPDPDALRPPRDQRFFWTFPGEVPADMPAEVLASIGRALT